MTPNDVKTGILSLLAMLDLSTDDEALSDTILAMFVDELDEKTIKATGPDQVDVLRAIKTALDNQRFVAVLSRTAAKVIAKIESKS